MPGRGSDQEVIESVLFPCQLIPRSPGRLITNRTSATLSTILDLTLEVLPHELDGVGRRGRADRVKVDESQLLQLGGQAPIGLILAIIDVLHATGRTVLHVLGG